MTDLIPVDELSFGVLDSKPIEKSWSAEDDHGEYREPDWQFWEAFDYEVNDKMFTGIACGGAVVAMFTPQGRRVGEDRRGRAGVVEAIFDTDPYEHGADGPMMNYWYPLGDDSDRIGGWRHETDAIGAAYRLRDLPLCVVEVDDKIGLALTGGGMDLTWEIVEAFTLLGYLPPVHFCDLPKMAGRGESEKDQYLIRAVARSLFEQKEALERDLSRHALAWGVGAGV